MPARVEDLLASVPELAVLEPELLEDFLDDAHLLTPEALFGALSDRATLLRAAHFACLSDAVLRSEGETVSGLSFAREGAWEVTPYGREYKAIEAVCFGGLAVGEESF